MTKREREEVWDTRKNGGRKKKNEEGKGKRKERGINRQWRRQRKDEKRTEQGKRRKEEKKKKQKKREGREDMEDMQDSC